MRCVYPQLIKSAAAAAAAEIVQYNTLLAMSHHLNSAIAQSCVRGGSVAEWLGRWTRDQ